MIDFSMGIKSNSTMMAAYRSIRPIYVIPPIFCASTSGWATRTAIDDKALVRDSGQDTTIGNRRLRFSNIRSIGRCEKCTRLLLPAIHTTISKSIM
jgi:hypothetical protein